MAFEGFKSISLSTASTNIVQQIRASILDGALPPGTQLNEKQLADQFAISRGPVREAMQRLIQEGLLRSEPHRGTFVVQLDAGDVADIYLGRRAVEHTAVMRLLRWEGTDVDKTIEELEASLDEMNAAVESGDDRGAVAADMRFHTILVDAARSQRLSRMYHTLVAEAVLSMASLADKYPDWRATVVREHREILDALRQRDENETLRILDEHFVLDDCLSYRGVMSHYLDPTRSSLGAAEASVRSE
ncbi:GntR family transcriptional regulator [Saccharopolyspora karakumensis]|uniref:GntR family transcriptional regulator n=1 Tax=Saccharopolyspora karakumensis TaxID=2530386 RepID=A0A4R5BD31_9PSEU|nr:GntR family transcriptional regulator [Saccharopolyspora karakumensis]TDD83465.1 GntR family transcriptional regulator [Saccharopolyspora karakumensis]